MIVKPTDTPTKLSEQYRIKADVLRARALTKSDMRLKRELEMLAQGYGLLAEQAKRNEHDDAAGQATDIGARRGKKIAQRTRR